MAARRGMSWHASLRHAARFRRPAWRRPPPGTPAPPCRGRTVTAHDAHARHGLALPGIRQLCRVMSITRHSMWRNLIADPVPTSRAWLRRRTRRPTPRRVPPPLDARPRKDPDARSPGAARPARHTPEAAGRVSPAAVPDVRAGQVPEAEHGHRPGEGPGRPSRTRWRGWRAGCRPVIRRPPGSACAGRPAMDLRSGHPPASGAVAVPYLAAPVPFFFPGPPRGSVPVRTPAGA